MTDFPILFSGPMVRALLDGRKTQTRRALKMPDADFDAVFCEEDGTWYIGDAVTGKREHKLPIRYRKGDRLWVREAWARTPVAPIIATIDKPMLVYRECDNRTDYGGPWKPGIHLPRGDSRLTLTVTDVRVQRLQEISEADALAEGVVWSTDHKAFIVPGVDHPCRNFPVLSRTTAREMYAALWDVINGSGQWLANPWVVALTFTVERRKIDA